MLTYETFSMVARTGTIRYMKASCHQTATTLTW